MKRFILFPLVLVLLLPVLVPSGGEDGAVVSKVLDGNTLELSSGEQVRLIGVEKSHAANFEEEAKGYLQRSFEGRKVTMELDETNKRNEHRDQENHLLAYLYLPTLIPDTVDVTNDPWYQHEPHEGFYRIFANASLIKMGLGTTQRDRTFSHQEKFLTLEQLAKEKKIGIWGGRLMAPDS